MRDLFPGFYEPTEQEMSKIWQDCIFVFDTNMLLNIYRYSSETRERFFETLSLLKERLWIPYQVAYEYQDRRLSVISEQIKAYDYVANLLDKVLRDLKSGLEPFKKRHAFIEPVELTDEITNAITDAKSKVLKAKTAHPKYKEADPQREKTDELFKGNVGKSYTKDEQEKKYQEAELRLQRQIPPGLEDADKKGMRKYGDIILWFQIIDYACSQKMPIIFITDDVKKDWWLTGEECQTRIKPRPELVQEMYAEANVLFYMYQGYTFMELAQKFLKLEEKPEVIEEIKEVGQDEQKSQSYLFPDEDKVSISNVNPLIDPQLRQGLAEWAKIRPVIDPEVFSGLAEYLKIPLIDPELIKVFSEIVKIQPIDPQIIRSLMDPTIVQELKNLSNVSSILFPRNVSPKDLSEQKPEGEKTENSDLDQKENKNEEESENK